MDAKALLAQAKSLRLRWVEVAPGKRVQVTRPTEHDAITHFLAPSADGKGALRAEMQQVCQFTVGWEGITEADILGAGVGSDTPAPFDPELWALLAADNLGWVRAVAKFLLQLIVEQHQLQASDAKN